MLNLLLDLILAGYSAVFPGGISSFFCNQVLRSGPQPFTIIPKTYTMGTWADSWRCIVSRARIKNFEPCLCFSVCTKVIIKTFLRSWDHWIINNEWYSNLSRLSLGKYYNMSYSAASVHFRVILGNRQVNHAFTVIQWQRNTRKSSWKISGLSATHFLAVSVGAFLSTPRNLSVHPSSHGRYIQVCQVRARSNGQKSCWRFTQHEDIAPAWPAQFGVQLSPAVLPAGFVTDTFSYFLNENFSYSAYKTS